MKLKFMYKECNCYIEYIHLELFNKSIGIGRTNPGSPNKLRRWVIVTDECLIDIRNNIFYWSTYIQDFLYKRNIYWHNWLKDECCPGFECCMSKANKEEQNILKNISRAFLEGLPGIHIRKN